MNLPSTASDHAIKNSAPQGSVSYRGPFAVMSILFFMWGFMTVWNDILIPRFKEAFDLTYFQAMLVQLAFFGAYGVGSLSYYFYSMACGDPINRIGYKNAVVLGLLTSAIGSALFLPAANQLSYPFFLLALFVVGLGFAWLQIAANPYVAILGSEATASGRLNLAQAFNSLGTTIGPMIGGWLIFKFFNSPGTHGVNSVKVPYLCFSAVFVVLAIVFKLCRLPNFSNTDVVTRGVGPLMYPHTLYGMLAIFMYVGGEVSVGSAIVNLLGSNQVSSLPPEKASRYLSFYWGGLMIGRFMGAIALGDFPIARKRILCVSLAVVACVTIGVSYGWNEALCFSPFLVSLVVAFLLGTTSANRMLTRFSVMIVVLLCAVVAGSGDAVKWVVLGVGLFCSVMWSNIFTLAIEGLGPLKSQASSLLVMAVVGGALLPPLQGMVADKFGLQISFVVPIIAFLYVAWFGAFGYRSGRETVLLTRA